jgi:protein-disulfide isomerase
MTKEVKVIIGIAVVIIAGGIFLFTRQPKQEQPSGPTDTASLIRDSSHMTGKKDAKVSVVEFGDYQCPACAAAAPTLSRLRAEYKDNADVNFVFRHFPLPQHDKAIVSAEAAEAAAKQNKFWEMTDKLYETQDTWIGPSDHQAVFSSIAQGLGLDMARFQQDLENHTFTDIINSDKSDGESLGVNSTPSIFINGEKMSGFQYDILKSKIEEKLK